MGAFDDFISKARDVADAATKATGEAIELSKQKLSSAKIASDIRKEYEILGQIVYDGKRVGTENTELIEQSIEKINALTKELDDLNRVISHGKNTVLCTACGNANPENAFFCSRCGASIEKTDK